MDWSVKLCAQLAARHLQFYSDQVNAGQAALGTERLLYIFEEMLIFGQRIQEVIIPRINELLQHNGKSEQSVLIGKLFNQIC